MNNDRIIQISHGNSCALPVKDIVAGWDAWGDEVPTADTAADCWGTQGDEIPIDPWEVTK